jgi:hypothetical protein
MTACTVYSEGYELEISVLPGPAGVCSDELRQPEQ